MPFIQVGDFDQSVHDDILSSLTRQDENVIDTNVNSTVDEMKGYLYGRCDVEAEFAKTGNNRNKFLLRIGLAISTYYIFSVHNPRKITQVVVSNYEKAIEDLEKIQKGMITPPGLAQVAPDDPTANSGNGEPVQWGSDCQLDSSY